MKIDFDDPKWTAYVLGELSPDERQSVELELEASEDLRAFVEELQIAAFAMKDAMAAEAVSGLTFQQRSAVRTAAAQPAPSPWFGPAARWAVGLAAAASVVALVAPSLWGPGPVETTQVAQESMPVPVDQQSKAPAFAGPAPSVNAPSPENPRETKSVSSAGGIAGEGRNESKNALGPAPPASANVSTSAQDRVSRQQEKLSLAEGASLERRDSLDGLPAGSAEAGRSGRSDATGIALSTPAPASVSGGRGNRGAAPTGGGARGGGGGGRGGAGGQAAANGAGGFGNDGIGNGQGQGFGFGSAETLTPPAAVAPPVAVARQSQSPSLPPVGIGTVLPEPVDILGRPNGGAYNVIGDNPFVFVRTQQVATFSIDVETASYPTIRRFINSGQLPPRADVRIEEMVNYFTYDYPRGSSDHPITANIEAAAAPWNPEHRLVRVGIKARDAQIGEKTAGQNGVAVARDVELKMEFNPAQVTAYRLVGYENRVLTSSDFKNDRKDAGDMGAGHSVTALFEVVPIGVEVNNFPGAGALRYQPAPPLVAPAVDAAVSKELLDLKIRFKEPNGTESKLIEVPLVDRGQSFASASVDFRFAAAVAEFGMLLRESPYRGASTWASSIAIARDSRGPDREGYREEFIRLVEQCERIARAIR